MKKKAQPVAMRNDDQTIIVEAKKPFSRKRIPPTRAFHTRDRDVATGRSRKPKHKKKEENLGHRDSFRWPSTLLDYLIID